MEKGEGIERTYPSHLPERSEQSSERHKEEKRDRQSASSGNNGGCCGEGDEPSLIGVENPWIGGSDIGARADHQQCHDDQALEIEQGRLGPRVRAGEWKV